MLDDFFFKQICDLIFQSGVKGAVWQKYEPEIRKEFRDYNVRKVARYTQKDVERMLANPRMLKNRRKIEACIHNAKEMLLLAKSITVFGTFWIVTA